MESSSHNHESESAEIRRAAGGDRGALAGLLDAHRPRLRRMVALRLDRRLWGRVDPSDVIQEVYLDAAAGFAEYAERAEMSFFVWLRWLAGMKINAMHRRHLGCQARDAGREVSIDRAAMPGATSAALAAQLLGRETSASEVAMRMERKARLEEAIDAMEPLDREVLILRHFEELTNAETAEALNIRETASRKRYFRALKRLKEVLGAMPGGSREFHA